MGYETTHTTGFVGLAILCSSSSVDPLLILTPGCVGISQVVKKNKTKQQTEGGRKKRQTRIQNCKAQEGEVGTF